MGIIINGKEKYRLDSINKCNATYNLIIGGRNIGKTYAVKEKFITDAYNSNGTIKFAYIRRWAMDLKRKYCNQYFEDDSLKKYINKISHGQYSCIRFKEDAFYFCTEKDGKIEYKMLIGYAFSLAQQEHYKSLNYNGCTHGIFEEWISDKMYLPDEPTVLENLISTIERDSHFTLYMCGNTLSRVIPYVTFWNLHKFDKQDKGTIDVYNGSTGKRIAVERCKESDENEKSTIKISNIRMNSIKNGEWDVREYPTRDYDVRSYTPQHIVVIEYDRFKFLCRLLLDKGCMWWDVERKTSDIEPNTRIISDNYYPTMLATNKLIGLNIQEHKILDLFKLNKIRYSDNLTGTEFERILKHFL